eukprot:gene9635-10623_t
MANFGYGFGNSQSQGYSNVHPPSSFATQASSAFGNQFVSSGPAAQRPPVAQQQSFDVGAGYGYGYGRQQDGSQNTAIPSSHQTSYGTSSYMNRGAGYDANKSNFGYGASSQVWLVGWLNDTSLSLTLTTRPTSHAFNSICDDVITSLTVTMDLLHRRRLVDLPSVTRACPSTSFVYGNQVMKQGGYSAGNTMYGSGQNMSHMSKPTSQSFMSQPGVSSAGYVGYGSVRSQQSAPTAGYNTTSQGGSSSGYANVGSSQVSSATAVQQKPRPPAPPKQQQGQQQQQQPNQPAPSNSYDSVVFNAATSFLSQSQQQKPPWQRQPKPQFKLHGPDQKQRQGPRQPQQLHYCEVCKISCAGPMTYKEHLEGQKHKKKAASIVTTNKEPVPPGSYRCELCDVTCTGIDAYNAHLKGARHVKTVKLHQKLGKPIPEMKTAEQLTASEKKTEAPKKVIQRPVGKPTTAPKINFVGGTKLLSTATGTQEVESVKPEEQKEEQETSTSIEVTDQTVEEQEIVGEEYIENIKSDVGKVMGYKCTLCDCRFNDVVARTAHMKGRRHRLNYKKKVQPSLKVEMKGSKYSNRGNNRVAGGFRPRDPEISWRQKQQEQMRWEQELRIREEELRRWEEGEYHRRIEEDRYWTRPDHQRLQELDHYEWERKSRFYDPSTGRNEWQTNGVPDDRLVMAKHANIYPNETELKQVQDIVSATEKALKLVSDQIAEEDDKLKEENKVEEDKEVKQEESSAEIKQESIAEEETVEPKKMEVNAIRITQQQTPRTLKGVMRVGVLSKGLLLHDKLDVELIVLCAAKPTLVLLNRVGSSLPEKLKDVAQDKYIAVIDEENGSIKVSANAEPSSCFVTISLTSPAMRDEDAKGVTKENAAQTAEPDVLNKEKCLKALASLRHSKWFQARAIGVPCCVIIIRIMRDLCSRVPAFQPLSEWAIELLVEKSLTSAPCPTGPGEALRRVFEVCASGIFLPGGTGLLDPCEKEQTDATANLNPQEREDVTTAAQHALRLHAFRQLHTVLDIEALKPPLQAHAQMRGKRRREDSRESMSKSTVAKLQKKDDSKDEEMKVENSEPEVEAVSSSS